MGSSGSGRKYTEAEFRLILAEAVDDGGAKAVTTRAGLSLEEIKEIGIEVGIDPMSLERAARSVDVARSEKGKLVGGATVLSVERRVEGALDPMQTGEILSVIRRGMGSTGDISEVQGILEWKSNGELGQRVVTLSGREGSISVSGMADLTQAAVITHLPAGLVGSIGSAIGFMISANSANEVGMVLCAALLPAVMLTTRKVFGRLSRSEGAKLERVVDDLAALVGTGDSAAQ